MSWANLTKRIHNFTVRAPSKPACLTEDKTTTYQELSNKIAQFISYFHRKNIHHKNISVHLPLSENLIALSISIFDSNNTYCPLDINMNIEEMNEFITLGNIDFIISELTEDLKGIRIVNLNEISEFPTTFEYPKEKKY